MGRRMSLIRRLLLMILVVHISFSSPRGSTDQLRGSHGLGLGKDWGLGLEPGALYLQELGESNLGGAVESILRHDSSPSVKLLLNDQLFLRHLELYLARPSKKHFHQLRNRAKTLRRRRTDEVSTRFFLR